MLGSWGSVGGWVARAQLSPCEAGSVGSDRHARQLQGCRANPRLRLPPPQSPGTICVGEPSLPRVWNGAPSRAHSTPVHITSLPPASFTGAGTSLPEGWDPHGSRPRGALDDYLSVNRVHLTVVLTTSFWLTFPLPRSEQNSGAASSRE